MVIIERKRKRRDEWSPEEEELLLEEYNDDTSIHSMKFIFHRNAASIKQKIEKLIDDGKIVKRTKEIENRRKKSDIYRGAKKRVLRPADDSDIRTRKCLCCGDQFLSTWAGNRICPECKRLEGLTYE